MKNIEKINVETNSVSSTNKNNKINETRLNLISYFLIVMLLIYGIFNYVYGSFISLAFCIILIIFLIPPLINIISKKIKCFPKIIIIIRLFLLLLLIIFSFIEFPREYEGRYESEQGVFNVVFRKGKVNILYWLSSDPNYIHTAKGNYDVKKDGNKYKIYCKQNNEIQFTFEYYKATKKLCLVQAGSCTLILNKNTTFELLKERIFIR